MLSQITRPYLQKLGGNQACIRRAFSDEIKRPDLIQTGNAKEVFIDSEKFKATGRYLVYQASNLNKVRLIFFASLGLCTYHTYSYFNGDELEFDRVANTLFASLSAITVGWTS